ncbi:hypothetical protein O0L34_g14493 [Tuta absoluta]|nr:hypothetical protein O0L34_g14493 [Tuta absoluta]
MRGRKRKATQDIDEFRRVMAEMLAPVIERLKNLEQSAASEVSGEPDIVAIKEPAQNRQDIGKTLLIKPPIKPMFEGKTHPVTFLTQLDDYFEKIKDYSTDDRLKSAISCLSGHALSWSKLYSTTWKNFDDFKKDFLQQYWGRDIQNKLKRKLMSGSWSAKDGRKMSHYFADLYFESQQLTTCPDDIVEDLMLHFPQYVKNLWVTNSGCGRSAKDANEFLRNLESVNEELPTTQGLQRTPDKRCGKIAAIEEAPPNLREQWVGREESEDLTNTESEEFAEN